MISSDPRAQVEVRPVTAGEALGAAALVLLAVLVFLKDGLPAETAPVCVDPLYANPAEVPFAEVRPEGFEPHHPYLSDQALVFDPWLRFMNRAVRDGEIPWWSPHSGGGVPFVGNLSSAFFFPTTCLSLLPPDVLSVERGMLFGAVLRLWLAGFFGYLFLRRLGLGRVGAATGAIGLTFFGYQVVWLFYSLSNVACMVPLCLWLADRFACRPSAGRTVALGVGMAVQFLGGHAETSVALAIAVTAWVVARGTAPERTAPAVTTALRYGLAGLLALALCAFQLLPFAEYLAVSQGRWERTVAKAPEFSPAVALASPAGVVLLALASYSAWASWRLLPRDPERATWGRAAVAGALLALAAIALFPLGLRPQLGLALAPGLFGSPLGGGYVGPETYTDVNGGYAGALATLLALAYLVFGTRRRVAWTFGGLLALAWVLPAHVEPFFSLLKAIPPFDLAANTRMLPLAGVGASVLAACAVDEILRAGTRARWSAGLRRLVLTGGTAFLVAVIPIQAWFDVYDGGGPLSGGRYPEVLPNGASRLVVPLRYDFARDVRNVRIEVGGATVFDGPPVDGEVATEWDATRAEHGRYDVRTIAAGPDGAVVEEERRPIPIERLPRDWPVRVGRAHAIALPVLLLLAFACVAAPWLALLVPLAVLAELWLFGYGYNAFVPEAWVFPETSVTRAVRAELDARAAAGEGPFRVWAEDVILQPNMHYAYDLQTARSYDQLEVRTFNQWMTWVTGGPVPFTRWNHDTVDYRTPLFDVTNVGYVITGDRIHDVEGFTLVLEAGGGRYGRVYRNERALPRAFVAGAAVDVRPALEEGRVADLLALDPRTTAFLEAAPPAELGGEGTVRFVEYGLHEVVLDALTDGPAMLVLTDNWFPGWEAEVDGEERPILRTHLTFRAVEVPAGESRVVFRYRPASVRLGLALAGLGALLAVGALLRGRFRRRKPEFRPADAPPSDYTSRAEHPSAPPLRGRAMIPTPRLSLALAAATTALAAALAWGAGGSGTFGFAFADGFQDDPVGAVPWGLVGAGETPILTEYGEIFTKWPADPRAIVEVVAVPGASGPNHVLRLSDANIHDGTAHSEVTVRPVGAFGNVSVRFELRLLGLGGDEVKLTIVDNRTTPGTGMLSTVTIRSGGELVIGRTPTEFALQTGKLYRFSYQFDLAGSKDSYSLSIQPVEGSGGGGHHVSEIPIPVDVETVTSIDFSLADGGQGTFDLDNIRVLNNF